MPSIPISDRADLTSSSLKGLIMALMSFIFLGLWVIRYILFAMMALVKTVYFLHRSHGFRCILRLDSNDYY